MTARRIRREGRTTVYDTWPRRHRALAAIRRLLRRR